MNKLVLKNTDEINTFIDPFRTKIMRVMKNEHRPMTVKEIADKMGEVPAKVHYHVKKLEAIGVLFIKYTKEINGIVAKYYDFTTETVSLSVPKTEEAHDLLASRMLKLYGSYFDEAKQKFYDCLNKDQDEDDYENYIHIKESIRMAPEMLDHFTDELSSLIKRYEYHGEDAINYYCFCALIQTASADEPIKENEKGEQG